ncbi:Transcription factor [Coemansia thaxteri]|uniref:Transcription factor n=1 Tax=Coemansia thaxteri TaxID=2663907 RepID=A0A9W8BM42_9FUNG|nr:Transcription factor [Coemansia thaxteri]
MSEGPSASGVGVGVEPAGPSKGTGTGRPKRQKVSKACVFCQRSHMSCDDKRPCQRCVKRNISHLCRDKDPADGGASATNGDARAGVSVSGNEGGSRLGRRDAEIVPIAPAAAGSEAVSSFPSTALSVSAGAEHSSSAAPLHADRSGRPSGIGNLSPAQPLPGPLSLPSLSASSSKLGQVSVQAGGASDRAHQRSSASAGRGFGGTMFDTNSLLFFGNDVASNEYSALNEFLETLQRGMRHTDRTDPDFRRSDPPSGSPSGPPSSYAMGSPLLEQSGQATQAPNSVSQLQPFAHASQGARSSMAASGPRASASGADGQERTQSLPTISQLMTSSSGEGVTQTERFLLTAADPNDGTSEDKLRQIINAKFDAGILKPYNYVNGYTRMQRFMEVNVSSPNIIRILEVLNTFRPTFRSIAQSLTDLDLLLVEEGFERLLLDYDNVFNSFGVPACLWRRTGEIYKANREFADLVGVPLSYFHEGRVCIYELMPENSTVNYWEKYGEIAFDATQKAVLTSCVLQTAASIRSMVHADAALAHAGSRHLSAPLKPATAVDASQPSPSQPSRPVRCCFSFTLRRDKYKIPLAIVGNFMPIQQQP